MVVCRLLHLVGSRSDACKELYIFLGTFLCGVRMALSCGCACFLFMWPVQHALLIATRPKPRPRCRLFSTPMPPLLPPPSPPSPSKIAWACVAFFVEWCSFLCVLVFGVSCVSFGFLFLVLYGVFLVRYFVFSCFSNVCCVCVCVCSCACFFPPVSVNAGCAWTI